MAGPRHRILLVEDDVGVRQVVRAHLGGRFEVEEAGSAEEVLDRLRRQGLSYTVALTDVHLPGMSGVQLSRLLLATQPLKPVIMITGDDDQGLAREALSYGASGYLLKPFELFELDATLAQAVAMCELVEATETLARAQSARGEDWGESGGSLPRSWLHLGDERSGAGTGHGGRVVSIAGALARNLADRVDARDREVLRTAARTHEIGRLVAPSDAGDVSLWTAQLLDNLGFDQRVCEVIRQAAQAWSPGLFITARILAVADRLDHEAVAGTRWSEEPAEAIRSAIGAISARSGEAYDPGVVEALIEERERVESMWVIQQGPAA